MKLVQTDTGVLYQVISETNDMITVKPLNSVNDSAIIVLPRSRIKQVFENVEKGLNILQKLVKFIKSIKK